jgi:hypothetical protein
VRVKPLSPYAVELEFPEADGRLVFELHVCGNFVVREYVGGELEAEYHLPTTYRFDIQAGKTVAKFAWRLGLDPKAALEELRERAGELPAIFLDRPLLQILKMFSRVAAQVPEAAPEDPLQLLSNATAGGLRIETLRESVVFSARAREDRQPDRRPLREAAQRARGNPAGSAVEPQPEPPRSKLGGKSAIRPSPTATEPREPPRG